MTQTKIAALRESWEPIFQPFAPEEQRAGIELLRDLTRGEPVGAARLADLLGSSTPHAESLLKESGLSRYVYWGNDGRVHGFWGLSTAPTHHRFVVNGRTLWAWCAADTLFLPALLGETARVESKDPQNGDVVRLTISPTRVESVEPHEVAVSIIRPDTVDHSDATKVIMTTCHYIFFFSSRASGERWVAAHPETVLVSLEEAVEFVEWVNARAFGHELERLRGEAA